MTALINKAAKDLIGKVTGKSSAAARLARMKAKKIMPEKTRQIQDHLTLNITPADIKKARKLVKKKSGESLNLYKRRIRKKAKEIRKEKMIKAGLIVGGVKTAAGLGALAYASERGDKND